MWAKMRLQRLALTIAIDAKIQENINGHTKQRELDVLLLTHLGLENSYTVFSWSKGVDGKLKEEK